VPIFQGQIASGGPVKVTHPEARRFFMTISEAVSLTLQASARSQGSEIFILDMGEPIRIVDLAENMIRLAGKIPYEDIDIQFTGLRPGEKLIEEVNGRDEGVMPTNEGKMRVIHDDSLGWDVVPAWIDELQDLLSSRQTPPILRHIQKLVPEYTPAASLMHDEEPLPYPQTQFTSLDQSLRNGNAAASRRRAVDANQPPETGAPGSIITCEH
jgi:FlaA1/EpsC-like NDP-sugar epimerase